MDKAAGVLPCRRPREGTKRSRRPDRASRLAAAARTRDGRWYGGRDAHRRPRRAVPRQSGRPRPGRHHERDTRGDRAALLDALLRRTATRAPTSAPRSSTRPCAHRPPGNLMLYSIVEIDDQALKAKLAASCDRPAVHRASAVGAALPRRLPEVDRPVRGVGRRGARGGAAASRRPASATSFLACCDALIAAQNAVIAAESLGIGSCYIGDIMENAETVAELLGLPNHTFPVTMLCFGRPAGRRRTVPRYDKHLVHRDALPAARRGGAARGRERPRAAPRPTRLQAGDRQHRPGRLRAQVRRRFHARAQPFGRALDRTLADARRPRRRRQGADARRAARAAADAPRELMPGGRPQGA